MKSVYYIYHSTRGSAGAYIHRLLTASNQAGIKAKAFVSSKYLYKTPGAVKHFFPFTESTEKRHLLLKLIRAIEYIVNLIFIWIEAIFIRPVIHLQLTDSSLPTYMFFRLCKISGLKIVTTCHDITEHDGAIPDRRRRIFTKSEWLVIHSEYARKKLTEVLNGEDNKIVKYPFPFCNFDSIISVQENKIAEENIAGLLTQGKKSYLSIGYVRESKGISLLYDAWREQMIDQEAELIIAGKWNPGLEDLKSKLGQLENVKIIDKRLSDAEFSAYIRLTDFAVLPYFDYAHSGILYSCAYSDGLPIISDIELFTELLTDYKLTFRSGDADDLGRILRDSLVIEDSEMKGWMNNFVYRVEEQMNEIPIILSSLKNKIYN